MFKSKIFCNGSNVDECVAGELTTTIPLMVGQKHWVKGKLWECVSLGKNCYDDTMADFKPVINI